METIVDKLGWISLNFSSLELMVSSFVTRLISEDSKIGAIVTSEMSFQNLIKAFDSLSRYKEETSTHLDEIHRLIRRLNIAEQERNRIIHSAYAEGDTPTNFVRIKTTAKQGTGLKFISEKVDIRDLKAITSEQIKLVKTLESLYKTIYKDEIIKYG